MRLEVSPIANTHLKCHFQDWMVHYLLVFLLDSARDVGSFSGFYTTFCKPREIMEAVQIYSEIWDIPFKPDALNV